MQGADQYDFFLSRRGSVATIAQEVADVLAEKGYKVRIQDYDFRIAGSFIEEMHEAIKGSRDLLVLYTSDYEQSHYTRKEFTSFEADRAQTPEERYIIILRCENVPLRGLFADNVFQDLVGIQDPEERKRRILAAAERQTPARRPPPRPFGVPRRIASFTGRAEEIDRLDAILVRSRPAAVIQTTSHVAVQGMGGVGKTSLAVEYAHRFRSLYAGVWWCRAETRETLMTSLAALLADLAGPAAAEGSAEVAAKLMLRRLAEQRATWLLIYDNVSSPDDIADLLPSAGASVLITSRFADFGELADQVSIDVLPIDEATAFLQRRAARSDQSGARSLAQALGCLPVALDHAAATCRRTPTLSFAEYEAKALRLIASAPSGALYPRSVFATFDLAIAETVVRSPASEMLMAFLAHCAPERIPATLIEGAIDDEVQRLEALAALAEVSLVKDDPFEDGTPAVTAHRLVQAVARARSEAQGTAKDSHQRIIARLLAIYPDDSFGSWQSWPLCAQLTPHLLTLRQTAPSKFADCPDLLRRAGNYFHWRASYSQAEPLLRDALAIYQRTLGSDDPKTAVGLVDLAGLLWDQGKLSEARPFFEMSLAIHERLYGPDHALTARSLNNLGALLRDQGELAEARPLLERALKIREREFGPDHASVATALTGLALLLQEQGNLAGARPLFERALKIREELLGPEHPNTAHSVNNLAELNRRQGDVGKAQSLFERGLAAFERTLGTDHPNTNRVRRNLARLHIGIGRPLEALTFGQAALAAHQTVLGLDHAWTMDSARVTAEALDAVGRGEEAAALRKRCGLT